MVFGMLSSNFPKSPLFWILFLLVVRPHHFQKKLKFGVDLDEVFQIPIPASSSILHYSNEAIFYPRGPLDSSPPLFGEDWMKIEPVVEHLGSTYVSSRDYTSIIGFHSDRNQTFIVKEDSVDVVLYFMEEEEIYINPRNDRRKLKVPLVRLMGEGKRFTTSIFCSRRKILFLGHTNGLLLFNASTHSDHWESIPHLRRRTYTLWGVNTSSIMSENHFVGGMDIGVGVSGLLLESNRLFVLTTSCNLLIYHIQECSEDYLCLFHPLKLENSIRVCQKSLRNISSSELSIEGDEIYAFVYDSIHHGFFSIVDGSDLSNPVLKSFISIPPMTGRICSSLLYRRDVEDSHGNILDRELIISICKPVEKKMRVDDDHWFCKIDVTNKSDPFFVGCEVKLTKTETSPISDFIEFSTFLSKTQFNLREETSSSGGDGVKNTVKKWPVKMLLVCDQLGLSFSHPRTLLNDENGWRFNYNWERYFSRTFDVKLAHPIESTNTGKSSEIRDCERIGVQINQIDLLLHTQNSEDSLEDLLIVRLRFDGFRLSGTPYGRSFYDKFHEKKLCSVVGKHLLDTKNSEDSYGVLPCRTLEDLEFERKVLRNSHRHLEWKYTVLFLANHTFDFIPLQTLEGEEKKKFHSSSFYEEYNEGNVEIEGSTEIIIFPESSKTLPKEEEEENINWVMKLGFYLVLVIIIPLVLFINLCMIKRRGKSILIPSRSSPKSKVSEILRFHKPVISPKVEEINLMNLKSNVVRNLKFSDLSIERQLSEGAFSRTYICQIPNQESGFVLKVLKEENDLKALEAMYQKDCVAIPYHPNIVTVLTERNRSLENIDLRILRKFDPFWEKRLNRRLKRKRKSKKKNTEYYYLRTKIVLMKYGRDTLFGYLESRKNSLFDFSTQEVCRMLLGLVRGVQHLHENKIVHRDLHLGNIFVDYNKGRIWIGDFGCALDLRSNKYKNTGFKVNKNDPILHTFDFVDPSQRTPRESTFSPGGGMSKVRAPEISSFVFSSKSVDFLDFEKSDLFSVGVVGYVIMCVLFVQIPESFQMSDFVSFRQERNMGMVAAELLYFEEMKKKVSVDGRIISLVEKLTESDPSRRIDHSDVIEMLLTI